MTEDVPWTNENLLEHHELAYQAPEILLDSKLGPSADIWSLAFVVYMLLIHNPLDDRTDPCSRRFTKFWD